MTDWVVYSRQDCSLCEQLLEELSQILGTAAADVRIVDVDDSAELQQKYGQRVPVLLADGEFLCAYRLDRERLAPYL